MGTTTRTLTGGHADGSRIIDFPFQLIKASMFDGDTSPIDNRPASVSTNSWHFNSGGTAEQQVAVGPTMSSLLGSTPASFGFSVWIRPDTNGDFDAVLGSSSDWNSWSDGFGLYQSSAGGELEFWVELYTGNVVVSAVDVGTGAWSHVAATYDGAAGEIHLWVNGQKSSVTSTIPATITSAGSIRMASTADVNDAQRYEGRMDEFVLFSDVLTDADADFLYTNGDMNDASAPDNALIWYRFGEDAADDVTATTGQLTDQSGNGNHATPAVTSSTIDSDSSEFPP